MTGKTSIALAVTTPEATAMSDAHAAPECRVFGVRHHGPGCALSLQAALADWQPDCVLVEGPAEADDLVPHVLSSDMQAPVALLVYDPSAPQRAVFYPFAAFSPEWQALQWAAQAGAAVQFMDLPRSHLLALKQCREEGQTAQAAEQAGATKESEGEVGDAPPALADALELPLTHRARRGDPLDGIARASGHADGESWWNAMVEERRDARELFAAIAELMQAVRADWTADDPALPQPAPEPAALAALSPDQWHAWCEALREAAMRQTLRAARKAGHQRIAVVCGAWHGPALLLDAPQCPSAKADSALLKGLPKLKLQATWIPWTHRHLASASGYGAGVDAPGWYGFLWQQQRGETPREVAWLSRVANLLRQRDLDCSSAHVIEAARLAQALAALRGHPATGLDDLHDATHSVISGGQDAALHLIADELLVGHQLGQVPADVPMHPLQRDLEQTQKRLRLKPEVLERTLDLDLRQPNDLARSHLLHRLRLLDLPWGEPHPTQRGSKGSFHELWQLQWQPEFVVQLMTASPWGGTIEQAATAKVLDQAHQATALQTLASLVDAVLLAQLGAAIDGVTACLQARAAITGDSLQLLNALPALANIYRYGSVRQIETAAVATVLDSLIQRCAIGLPLACCALDEEAAQKVRESILAGHAAVALRDAPELREAWQTALARIAQMDSSAALLRGLATRLLLDEGAWSDAEAGRWLSLSLSSAAEPADAAAWLEGFLNRNGLVLLHDPRLWALVDAWVSQLHDSHFVQVLPLLRRAFAAFSASERRALGERAHAGTSAPALAPSQATAAPLDLDRAAAVLPLLHQWLGIRP